MLQTVAFSSCVVASRHLHSGSGPSAETQGECRRLCPVVCGVFLSELLLKYRHSNEPVEPTAAFDRTAWACGAVYMHGSTQDGARI
jgi:hypothetical protein